MLTLRTAELRVATGRNDIRRFEPEDAPPDAPKRSECASVVGSQVRKRGLYDGRAGNFRPCAAKGRCRISRDAGLSVSADWRRR